MSVYICKKVKEFLNNHPLEIKLMKSVALLPLQECYAKAVVQYKSNNNICGLKTQLWENISRYEMLLSTQTLAYFSSIKTPLLDTSRPWSFSSSLHLTTSLANSNWTVLWVRFAFCLESHLIMPLLSASTHRCIGYRHCQLASPSLALLL